MFGWQGSFKTELLIVLRLAECMPMTFCTSEGLINNARTALTDIAAATESKLWIQNHVITRLEDQAELEED